MFLRFQQLADGIVHHKGRVGQRRPLAAAQGGDEHIVFVKLYLLGIAENIGCAQLPAGLSPMSMEELTASTGSASP